MPESRTLASQCDDVRIVLPTAPEGSQSSPLRPAREGSGASGTGGVATKVRSKWCRVEIAIHQLLGMCASRSDLRAKVRIKEEVAPCVSDSTPEVVIEGQSAPLPEREFLLFYRLLCGLSQSPADVSSASRGCAARPGANAMHTSAVGGISPETILGILTVAATESADRACLPCHVAVVGAVHDGIQTATNRNFCEERHRAPYPVRGGARFISRRKR